MRSMLAASFRKLRSAGADPGAWRAGATRLLRSLGPYAAIELLLPGGSLIVLLVWLYRRRSATRCAPTAPGYA